MNGLIPTSKKTNFSDELKKHSPTIAFFAGNALLLLGEFRVYDYVHTLTGEPWKAWYAVGASFLPFVIWELAVQHDKATTLMRTFAWVGIVISLGMGIAVGVADFVMVDGASASGETLMPLLALGLSAHALLLLGYFYSHPDQKVKRLMAQAIGRESIALMNAKIAKSILTAARQRLSQERSIASEFGEEELAKVLANLTGETYEAPEQDDAVTSAPPQSMGSLSDADVARVADLLAAKLSAGSMPVSAGKAAGVVQVPLWSQNGNNNGAHHATETKPPLVS